MDFSNWGRTGRNQSQSQFINLSGEITGRKPKSRFELIREMLAQEGRSGESRALLGDWLSRWENQFDPFRGY